jgi:hypothetical protein
VSAKCALGLGSAISAEFIVWQLHNTMWAARQDPAHGECRQGPCLCAERSWGPCRGAVGQPPPPSSVSPRRAVYLPRTLTFPGELVTLPLREAPASEAGTHGVGIGPSVVELPTVLAIPAVPRGQPQLPAARLGFPPSPAGGPCFSLYLPVPVD